jgi:hypothetical protein
MREKYLSMSVFKINELKPVELLNITFEHNKKKELITKLQSSSRISQQSKSSSSSLKNEASFNIFEEKSCKL